MPEKEELSHLESEAGTLPHLISNRLDTLEVARDRESVITGHLVKPFIRHHRREQTSILALTVSQSAHDLRLAPCAKAGGRIRSEV